MEQQEDSNQYIFSEYNNRLRDIEERNRILKERVLLISKNLLNLKEEFSNDLQELKRTVGILSEKTEKLKSTCDALVQDSGKQVKKEEMLIVERMLQDFQPLEFVRMVDLERVLEEKLKNLKK